jgi:hypothetical protein
LEATLGVGLPTVLLPDKMIEEAGLTVKRAATEISLLLGYKPGTGSDNGRIRTEFRER